MQTFLLVENIASDTLQPIKARIDFCSLCQARKNTKNSIIIIVVILSTEPRKAQASLVSNLNAFRLCETARCHGNNLRITCLERARLTC